MFESYVKPQLVFDCSNLYCEKHLRMTSSVCKEKGSLFERAIDKDIENFSQLIIICLFAYKLPPICILWDEYLNLYPRYTHIHRYRAMQT